MRVCSERFVWNFLEVLSLSQLYRANGTACFGWLAMAVRISQTRWRHCCCTWRRLLS